MKMIPAIQLEAGMVTETAYFNATGELLFARGVEISEKQLDILRRRNIFEVYAKDVGPDDELSRILNKEFHELAELDLGDSDDLDLIDESLPPVIPEALRSISDGEKGLNQLICLPVIDSLDHTIERALTDDRPDGPPLNSVMTQVSVAERNETYKDSIEKSYRSALVDVKSLMLSLTQGTMLDGGHVENIVKLFVKIFVTDRNILLNLSGVKTHDPDYLFNHSLNVCLLSLNIAASAGYSKRQIVEVGMGALLHDVGMLLVPRTIRFKKGRLTTDELYEVQKHPILGLHLLERISHLPDTVAIMAYQSHERANGTGYPRKRKDHLIHRFSKMVQCADVFEAVSSPRAYRDAMAPYKGMEMLIKMARQGFLATDYVRAFLSYMSLFPVGSIVELNDHRIAKVVAPNGESFAKPVVSILLETDGTRVKPESVYQVDLSCLENESLQVVRSHSFDFMNDISVMQGF